MALFKNSKYDLKKKYRRVLEIGMILSLASLVLAFKFFPKFEIEQMEIEHNDPLVTVDNVDPTLQKPEVPPPPKPPVLIEAPTDDVLDDIEVDDTELIIEQRFVDTPPPPEIEDEDDTDVIYDIFTVVELMPTPIGGIQGIMSKIEYPDLARRAGIQGQVYIYAYVDEEGNVMKAEVAKGIGGGCDEEALAAILETKFNPGQQRGRNVKVKVAVPVLFKIE